MALIIDTEKVSCQLLSTPCGRNHLQQLNHSRFDLTELFAQRLEFQPRCSFGVGRFQNSFERASRRMFNADGREPYLQFPRNARPLITARKYVLDNDPTLLELSRR
jgi:hypothetical protein